MGITNRLENNSTTTTNVDELSIATLLKESLPVASQWCVVELYYYYNLLDSAWLYVTVDNDQDAQAVVWSKMLTSSKLWIKGRIPIQQPYETGTLSVNNSRIKNLKFRTILFSDNYYFTTQARTSVLGKWYQKPASYM